MNEEDKISLLSLCHWQNKISEMSMWTRHSNCSAHTYRVLKNVEFTEETIWKN